MPDEINLSPFERSIVGYRGIVLRKNLPHVSDCRTAFARRQHPLWSRFNCGFRVEEAA